jgi:PAS domain S-box-containing protein
MGMPDGADSFLAHIVNALPSPVFVKDDQHRFVLFNDAFCAVMGRSRAELLGRSDLDFVPAEEARVFWEVDAAVFATGASHENEESLTDSAGLQHWIVTRKSLVKLPDGGRFLVAVISDITARKRAEERLAESEQLKSTVIASALDSIVTMDAAGRVVEFNPAPERTFGYPPSAVLGRRMSDFAIPERYRQSRDGVLTGLLATDGESVAGHRVELTALRADGSEFPAEIAVTAMTVNGVSQSTAFLRDITERATHEGALQRERDRAQRYLDIARVMIVVLNADETVAVINRRACEVLGVAEADAVGQNWYDAFVIEAQREQDRADFQALIAGQRSSAQDVDRVVLTRYGEVRIISWHDTLLRSEDGTVTGTISSGEDITERRATERKRDEFRALIEATAEATPDGILVTDTGGRYLFWNRHFKEYWNLPEEYLRLRQTGPALTPELLRPVTDKLVDPEGFFKRLASCYESGFATSTFGEMLLKDGRVLMTYSARVEIGDRSSGAIAWIYRDVTEQKKRQSELAQSQRLNAIGKLSGGVAHDFNNLLTVIGGNLELIKEWADAGSSIPELARSALAAVERGAEVTKRLLAFSRRQPLDPQRTDINALVTEVMALLPRLIGETIRVQFAPGAKLWHTVVDLGLLQSALMNLAINARDAMPDGGSLVIETGNAALDESYTESLEDQVEPGDYVMIAVSDDGQGMSQEVAKRAFEPFFTTKPVGKGTGLGLSMVYGFVKQSGGHVALYSEEGQGTTARIYLPRAVGDAASDQVPPPLAAPRNVEHGAVLLVEDDPAVGRVAKMFLENLGYQVIEARSGPRALEILRRGDPIDLLFTDVVLPDGMNGAEIARAAQALRPSLKVLFASGYSEHVLMHQGRLAEGVVLLQKPYRKLDLADGIHRVLGT